jgi:hypothetical protein
MPDNIGYSPGSGAVIAADDIGGVLHQRVKVAHGSDGSAVDVSADNPLPVDVRGELMEAIEALRMAVNSLTRTIGMALPNAQGFPIMEVRQGSAGSLAVTASIAANQTLSTLINQQQAGGFAMQDHIPALMHMQADGLRANILVT